LPSSCILCSANATASRVQRSRSPQGRFPNARRLVGLAVGPGRVANAIYIGLIGLALELTGLMLNMWALRSPAIARVSCLTTALQLTGASVAVLWGVNPLLDLLGRLSAADRCGSWCLALNSGACRGPFCMRSGRHWAHWTAAARWSALAARADELPSHIRQAAFRTHP
jgi:hypothetical protein